MRLLPFFVCCLVLLHISAAGAATGVRPGPGAPLRTHDDSMAWGRRTAMMLVPRIFLEEAARSGAEESARTAIREARATAKRAVEDLDLEATSREALEELVLRTVAKAVMAEARRDPERLARGIERTKAGISDACEGKPAALGGARACLIELLLNAAPETGLAEYRELRSKLKEPSAAPVGLHMSAVTCYMRQGRGGEAGALLEEIASTNIRPCSAAGFWIVRTMIAAAEGSERAPEFARRAMEAALESDNEMMIAAAHMGRLSAADAGAARLAIIEEVRAWARGAHDRRLAALMTASTVLHEPSPCEGGEQAVRFAAEALRRSPLADPSERVSDWGIIIASVAKHYPQLAVELGAEVEAFAREHFAGGEEIRRARVLHAKALRLAGDERGLAAYADLDLEQKQLYRFGFHAEVGDDPDCVRMRLHIED